MAGEVGARRTNMRAIGGVVLVAAIGAASSWGIWQVPQDDAQSASPAEEAAVLVNGVPIPRAAIDDGRALLGAFPAQELDASDEDGFLEYAIDQELLRQEAMRRGLEPSDAELEPFMASQIDGLASALDDGSLPSDIAEMLEGYRDGGKPISSWIDDPVMREAYRTQLLTGMLYDDETSHVEPGPNRDAEVQEAIGELVVTSTEVVDTEPRSGRVVADAGMGAMVIVAVDERL